MTVETKTRYTFEDNDNLDKQLSELIAQGINIGDEIAIDENVWRVLEKDNGWIRIWLCRGRSEDMVFDENGSNNYEKSSIREYLHGEYRKTVPHGLLKLTHGNDFELLSKEEVERLMPEEIQRIHCDENGETWWWWTRSAHRAYASGVCGVSTSGDVYYGNALYASRCAPSVFIR